LRWTLRRRWRSRQRRRSKRRGLTKLNEDEGEIVGERAVAPGGDAVEDGLLHFGKGLGNGAADKFLKTIDTQHFFRGIEDFGEAVCVKDQAIAGDQFDIVRGLGRNGVGETAEDAALRVEAVETATREEHGGRMSGGGESHAAAALEEASRGHGEIETVGADAIVDEIVEVTQELAGRRIVLEFVHGFGVDTVGDESGANAMTRNIADQEAEEIVAVGEDDAEVATDGTGGAVIGLDSDVVPDEAARCEGLLDAGGEREFSFDFALAFFETDV